MKVTRERLGVYVDTIYQRIGHQQDFRLAMKPTNYAHVGIFIPEVAKHFSSLTLFGRTVKSTDVAFVPLPPNINLIELPYYPDLRQLGSVIRCALGTAKSFWNGLAHVDTVWIFGPHPFGLLLLLLARTRGKKVVLAVRMDAVAYYRARMPSRLWLPLLLPIYVVEYLFRLLSRRFKTIVTGPELARRYGSRRRPALAMYTSVVPAEAVATSPKQLDWNGPIQLVNVGRLDPEKNPLLLVGALAELEQSRPGRYQLTWVGIGPMEDAIRARASELGIDQQVHFAGYVKFGAELLSYYRRSHIFVHVSYTEGAPRVIMEALSCGTSIVATDVGGVRRLLADGQAGLLVPPASREALVSAIELLTDDARLRNKLIEHGIGLAQELTLEEQSKLVARYIAS